MKQKPVRVEKGCQCKECLGRPRCENMCREWLEKHAEKFMLCSDNHRMSIDRYLAEWLLENGGKEFLGEDVTYGYMISGVSENIMCSFQGKTFKGAAGKFKVQATYGMHSSRSFELWPV